MLVDTVTSSDLHLQLTSFAGNPRKATYVSQRDVQSSVDIDGAPVMVQTFTAVVVNPREQARGQKDIRDPGRMHRDAGSNPGYSQL